MSGLEFNKMAASVLVAGLVAMTVGKITDVLYQPNLHPTRGYQVAVEEASGNTAVEAEVVIKIGQLMATANADKGKDHAAKCAICHNFSKDGATKIGPDLWNIVGAAKAKKEGFTYSAAMASKGGAWGYEELYHFLSSPRKYVPGTKMGFAGFKKSEEITDTIAFLRSLSDSQVPLPKPE